MFARRQAMEANLGPRKRPHELSRFSKDNVSPASMRMKMYFKSYARGAKWWRREEVSFLGPAHADVDGSNAIRAASQVRAFD